MPEIGEERFRCHASISAEGIEVPAVLCKVFLPSKLTDPVLLHFVLTKEQERRLDKLWKFSVRCTVEMSPGQRKIIYADKVYAKRTFTQHWQPDIAERILEAVPVDLRIETLREIERETLSNKSYGSFWLTPSRLLSPAQSILRSYTGEVEVKTVGQITFTLNSGLPLSFTNYFRYREDIEGETVTYTELVAEFEIEGDEVKSRVENAISEIDDLLLLASFAERQRCLCLGYDTSESDGTLRQYYCKDLAIPEIENARDRWLIDKADIQDYMNTTHRQFTTNESINLLRRAINFTIPNKGRTTESSFVSLFSALETMVLYFRRKANLVTVFSDEEQELQKRIIKDIKKFIKQHQLLVDPYEAKKELLYQNLAALARVSFGTAYKACLTALSVEVDDLWPVTGSDDQWSLTSIRNRLVHGEYFNRAQLRVIMVATLHLQWIVERIILTVLGWDISRSNVSPNYLSHIIPYKEWVAERALLFG